MSDMQIASLSSLVSMIFPFLFLFELVKGQETGTAAMQTADRMLDGTARVAGNSQFCKNDLSGVLRVPLRALPLADWLNPKPVKITVQLHLADFFARAPQFPKCLLCCHCD
jgi:hypothetical protein